MKNIESELLTVLKTESEKHDWKVLFPLFNSTFEIDPLLLFRLDIVAEGNFFYIKGGFALSQFLDPEMIPKHVNLPSLPLEKVFNLKECFGNLKPAIDFLIEMDNLMDLIYPYIIPTKDLVVEIRNSYLAFVSQTKRKPGLTYGRTHKFWDNEYFRFMKASIPPAFEQVVKKYSTPSISKKVYAAYIRELIKKSLLGDTEATRIINNPESPFGEFPMHYIEHWESIAQK